MRNCLVLQSHRSQLGLSPFPRLTNRIGDFISLAKTEANTSLFIAHHDQGAETETTATLDDLCGSIDEDRLLNKSTITIAFRLLVATTRPVPSITTVVTALIWAITPRGEGHWWLLG